MEERRAEMPRGVCGSVVWLVGRPQRLAPTGGMRDEELVVVLCLRGDREVCPYGYTKSRHRSIGTYVAAAGAAAIPRYMFRRGPTARLARTIAVKPRPITNNTAETPKISAAKPFTRFKMAIVPPMMM